MEWSLTVPPNAAVFTSRRVVNGQAAPVRVIRDDEGDWQALDAPPRGEGEGALLALQSLLELHPDLRGAVELLDQRGDGWQAVHDDHGEWILLPYPTAAA